MAKFTCSFWLLTLIGCCPHQLLCFIDLFVNLMVAQSYQKSPTHTVLPIRRNETVDCLFCTEVVCREFIRFCFWHISFDLSSIEHQFRYCLNWLFGVITTLRVVLLFPKATCLTQCNPARQTKLRQLAKVLGFVQVGGKVSLRKLTSRHVQMSVFGLETWYHTQQQQQIVVLSFVLNSGTKFTIHLKITIALRQK